MSNHSKGFIFAFFVLTSQGLFYPTPYLGYGTLQAFYAGYSGYCDPNIQFSPEVLQLPDGGKIGMCKDLYLI